MGEGVQPGQRETSSFGTTAATSCFFFFFFFILRLTPPVFFFFSFFFYILFQSQYYVTPQYFVHHHFRSVHVLCRYDGTQWRRNLVSNPVSQAARGSAAFFFFILLGFFSPFCAIMFFPRGGWESSVYLSCKVIFILFIFGFYFKKNWVYSTFSPAAVRVCVAVRVRASEGVYSFRHQSVRDHCLQPTPPPFFSPPHPSLFFLFFLLRLLFSEQ